MSDGMRIKKGHLPAFLAEQDEIIRQQGERHRLSLLKARELDAEWWLEHAIKTGREADALIAQTIALLQEKRNPHV